MVVLSVAIYAPGDKVGDVRSLLVARDGVDHVVVGRPSADGDDVLVTAELSARVVDALLTEPVAQGVAGDEIAIVHRDSQRPLASSASDLPA